MGRSKTVDWRSCDCGGKRGFASEAEAAKALGRARSKRTRRADATGTRRGLRVENRYYQCESGSWHLTSESRSTYEKHVAVCKFDKTVKEVAADGCR